MKHRASASARLPILVSVPHAGLEVAPEREELKRLPRETFLRDVDFEVHRMWESSCARRDVSFVRAETHRYVVDLNRQADQYSRLSVEGAGEPGPSPKKTLFWFETTRGERLLSRPMSPEDARRLIDGLWRPYHEWIRAELERLRQIHGYAILIDGHSMPSQGTAFHADPGARRADIVPGDNHGRACDPRVLTAAVEAAAELGLRCTPNDPYSGGGITQNFGRPATRIHALQIEVNRALYMDESQWTLYDDGLRRLTAYADLLLEKLSGLRI